MVKLVTGFLYKKKIVKYQGEEYEVFKFLDYAPGIYFFNTEKNYKCEIIDGPYAEEYVFELDNESKNEGEYVFIRDDIEQAVEDNDNKIQYFKIKNKKIDDKNGYWIRDGNKNQLKRLVDEDLLTYIRLTEYDEDQQTEMKQKPVDLNNISSVYSHIRRSIVAQDEPLMQIVASIFKNQKVANSDLGYNSKAELRNNILIYGLSGTGKTEILKKAADLYGIPMVTIDALTLSKAEDKRKVINDALYDLYISAGKNIKTAEKGILAIDRFDLFDKYYAANEHMGDDAKIILDMLDGDTFTVDEQCFNTSILTIVGMLSDPPKLKRSNLYMVPNDKIISEYDENFKKYALNVIGELNEKLRASFNIVPMNPILKDDIIEILDNPYSSPLKKYKKLFKTMNIDFKFDENFVEHIADEAMKSYLGARSIKEVVDKFMSKYLYDILTGQYSKAEVEETTDITDKPYIITMTNDQD